MNDEQTLSKLKTDIENSSNIIFLVGAGISVSAGLETFLDRNDYKRRYIKEKAFSIDLFKMNPKGFYLEAKQFLEKHDQLKPTPFHNFIRYLHDQNKLLNVITQNIDGLEKQLLPKNKYVQLHGNFDTAYCSVCSEPASIDTLTKYINKYSEKLDELSDDFYICNKCKRGFIRPSVILYGDPVCFDKIEECINNIKKADLFIISGTSLRVQPAASFLTYFENKDKIYMIDPYYAPDDKIKNVIKLTSDQFANYIMNQ